MTDRPIIFSSPMVRALIEGRKTQTRRALNPQPAQWQARVIDITEPFYCEEEGGWGQVHTIWDAAITEPQREVWCPLPLRYAVGDRLWVREAFSYESLDVDRNGFMAPWYWADGNPSSGDFTKPKPSIHMPRWASRLTLLVTDVRVQRVREISEEDATAEGMTGEFVDYELYGQSKPYRYEFIGLWDSLNASRGYNWEANPWVVAISFTVECRNIDALEVAA